MLIGVRRDITTIHDHGRTRSATRGYTTLKLLVLREGERREARVCTGTAPLDSVEDGASSCEFHCRPDMLGPYHAFSDELPMSTKCFA